MAARMPAQPAPTTRTSCSAITADSRYLKRPRAASDVRARGGERRAACRELLEVGAKHLGELCRLPVVRPGILPGRAWVEECSVDTRDLDGDLEAEHRVGPVLHAAERTRECRVQQRAR